MLGPFTTASRRTPYFTLPFTRCRYCSTPPLSQAACASMSTTTTTTTTTRDRGDRYCPIEWAQQPLRLLVSKYVMNICCPVSDRKSILPAKESCSYKGYNHTFEVNWRLIYMFQVGSSHFFYHHASALSVWPQQLKYIISHQPIKIKSHLTTESVLFSITHSLLRKTPRRLGPDHPSSIYSVYLS